jgi:hypothetical protein
MARKEELDWRQLVKVIHAKQGVLSQVARAMDCHLTTIYNYRDRYANVAQAIKDARNTFDTELLDEAEIKLREATRDGAPWAVKYTLSTKGKTRGYVERQEITGADGGTIRVTLTDD